MTGAGSDRLRLVSYNIQAGTSTANYREYVTRSWRQVLPNNQRVDNLDAIADLVGPYDIVGLQEAPLVQTIVRPGREEHVVHALHRVVSQRLDARPGMLSVE